MRKTLIVALAALAGATVAEAAPVKLGWEAYRVVDADTIHLHKSGNYVRAIGYDSPEPRGKCESEKRKAEQATQRFKELTSAPHNLTIRYAKGKDRYGRSLGHFYSDRKPIGPILIAEGLAVPMTLSNARRGKVTHNWCFQPSQN